MSRAAKLHKFKMVQVELARAEDFGKNDTTFIVNTHLGDILQYNDTVLGYDLETMNLNKLDELEHSSRMVPPAVLVRKTYPKFRKRQKHRIWKLKQLPKEELGEENIHGRGRNDKYQGNKKNKDQDMFLRDIEEDVELRNQIDLYRVRD